jgi:hypothetical protein
MLAFVVHEDLRAVSTALDHAGNDVREGAVGAFHGLIGIQHPRTAPV